MPTAEVIMMLLEVAKGKQVMFDVTKQEAIEYAETWLYQNGFRTDGLTGETWIKE